MKLFIANDSKQSIGGGWSFIGNLIKGLDKSPRVDVVNNLKDCDVVLLPSSSMILPETVEAAKNYGKQIFLRVDNIPRNSRNRNCGTSRLSSYARQSDGVIFQSHWAREYIGWWLEKIEGVEFDSKIILNGVDTDIFNKEGATHNPNIYLYSRFNRDETKNWHEAWYTFLRTWRENRKAKLWIVGQFSPELIEYNFDFFQGEDIEYKGIITDPMEMASLYKQAGTLLAPYFNDACSNTILEARACGTKVIASFTGGTPEIVEDGLDYSLERMTDEYIDFFEGGPAW